MNRDEPWLYRRTNLLPEDTVAEMESIMLAPNFPWYWNEHTLAFIPEYHKTLPQFLHTFYVDGSVNSTFNIFPVSILNAIEKHTGLLVTETLRTKANLLCSMGDVAVDQRYEIHSDASDLDNSNLYSAVYYVGVSDGDTVFFTDDEIEIGRAAHERNSVVVFKSKIKHRGSLPRHHKRRVVINLVFRGQQ